jgi:tetratricopeptide (TPR) repeat protein
MLSQAKRTGDVESDLQALARDFPEVEQYQFELARFYTSQGRVEEADALLQQVVKLDPENVENRLGYVQFLALQRDQDQAMAALKAFIEESPENTRLRLALAQMQERREQIPAARESYEALAKLSPKSDDGLEARNRLAALDIQAGKMDAARDRVEAILADVPDNAQALLFRAVTRVADNRLDDAVADLRLALRKDDGNEKALLLLAQVYARKGDLVLSKDSYRRLLTVNPDSAEGLNELAALLVAEKDLAGAEELLRKRLATQPDDILASGRLVEVLMAKGETARTRPGWVTSSSPGCCSRSRTWPVPQRPSGSPSPPGPTTPWPWRAWCGPWWPRARPPRPRTS